ncbi:N-acetyl-D-glucosamine kinase [uncultured archaeon]|nr:N-acetyl-D-glucosamine kinase [uncultured archaeon]
MYSIAIDFGGTKIKGAIIGDKGTIYTTCRIPTEADKGKERIIRNLVSVINFLSSAFEKQMEESQKAPLQKLRSGIQTFRQKLLTFAPPGLVFSSRFKIPKFRIPKEFEKLRLKEKVIKKFLEVFKPHINGVGISMPGFTDKKGKVIFGGGTLTSLVGVNLKKELEDRTKFPVFIENDANCFALAEAVHGAGKRYNAVLGVIWGTGIGGGLVINKKIYSGAFKDSLEFGHMVIDPNLTSGPKCGCGHYGCLEMLASGKNISRRYYELGGKIKNAGAREVYLSSEPAAKKAISDAIHYLGLGLADMVDAFNPEVIVMGGSVSRFPPAVYGRLKKEIKKYALPVLAKNILLVRYKISADEGILGAAEVVRYSTEPNAEERMSEISKELKRIKLPENFDLDRFLRDYARMKV